MPEQEESLFSQGAFSFLVTGAAGFIGSNLSMRLVELGQKVTGLDNFSTGKPRNIEEVAKFASDRGASFRFIEGDICDLPTCQTAVAGVDFVLHQAALGSVPRSLQAPLRSHASNVDGFVNMLLAARDAKVRRMVYAASSSTYGDHPDLPKQEDRIGRPLSPYAVTKYVNELYADVFARSYGFSSIGLRYFNVFGPRQDPEGAYAAVIPKWIFSLIKGDPVHINGDGETSRDFCFIDNVVQANLRACLSDGLPELHRVYNIAVGDRTTLNELYAHLVAYLAERYPHVRGMEPVYREFRPGDVRHSLASIERAERELGYRPSHRLSEGLGLAMDYYIGLFEETRKSLV